MKNRTFFRRSSKAKTRNTSHVAGLVRRYLLLAAVMLGLIGSFFLPNAVAGFMDARKLENLVVTDAQSILFSSDPELNLPGRIELAANSSTEVLALATGQVMERSTAESKAIEELAKLFGERTFEFVFDECIVEEGSSGFAVNSTDPSESMITWEFKILDRFDNEATVMIDDETGIILKLIYRRGNGVLNPRITEGANASLLSDEETRNIATQLTEMMTAYYGFPVGLGDYQFNGNIAYYMAYMSDGNSVIPLYGVVRATGFTMNERL